MDEGHICAHTHTHPHTHIYTPIQLYVYNRNLWIVSYMPHIWQHWMLVYAVGRMGESIVVCFSYRALQKLYEMKPAVGTLHEDGRTFQKTMECCVKVQ